MLARGIISIFTVIGFSILFCTAAVTAQQSTPPAKISLTSSSKPSPFVEGKTLIADVLFDGLDIDEEIYGFKMEDGLYLSDFLKYHLSENERILPGQKFELARVGKLILLLKKWLAAEGYLKADVIALGTKLPNKDMVLTFSISRGIPLDPPELQFVGNLNLSAQDLIDDFKTCSGRSWERYDLRRYQYYGERCSRRFLLSRGFLQGKVSGLNAKLEGNRYVVTFGISEGIRYRWGEIKIEGSKVFSSKEILEMFGQNTGDVADARYMQDFVYEKLKKKYDDRGYIQYVSEFDPEFVDPQADGVDGTINAVINIDEGCRFAVRRIVFSGVDADEQKALIEKFPLKTSEIFDRSKLESGITEVNESSEYSPLTIDSDVDLLVSDEHCTVDIVIKLKKVSK